MRMQCTQVLKKKSRSVVIVKNHSMKCGISVNCTQKSLLSMIAHHSLVILSHESRIQRFFLTPDSQLLKIKFRGYSNLKVNKKLKDTFV